MNILVLAPHAFYVDRGTPIDVDLLLRALSARGESVDVLCYHEGEDRDYPGVVLHRISGPSLIKNVGPGFSIKKLICDVYMFFRAWRLLRSNSFDVIHAGEEAVFIAMWLKMLYGIPYVYDMDSSIAQQMVEKMRFLRPVAGFFNWCEARAIRNSIAAAPVCHALADLAEKRGAPFIETLHDISQLDHAQCQTTRKLRQEVGLADDAIILMYVGNLETYQGVDLLLDAFAIACKSESNVQLVIAGGTDEHIEQYRQKTAALGAAQRVHFIGRWPVDRLGELLAEADILTAPRIRGVNTPMKVFPYMHSGKPLLVTDLPTHSQILDQSVARLAPPEPQGFAEAIIELAGDAALRRKLGEAGRRFVENNHTFEAHQRRVNRLYDRIAGKEAATSSAESKHDAITG